MIQKYLAEKQHVLGIDIDIDPKPNAGWLHPAPIGINKATTFYGYCGTHDNELFLPLETREFAFEQQQIALLGFRAFSHELYCKDAELDLNALLKVHMLEHPELQTLEQLEYLNEKRIGCQNARRNLADAWQKFGNIITIDSAADLRYYAVRFEDTPVYFTSVGFLPEWDFNGNLLQDLLDIRPFQGIAFSAWAACGDAAAVFCWHKSWDSVCVPFVESLRSIDESRLASRILAMAFEVSENIIFRPSWWEGLSQRDKSLLAMRVSSGLNFHDRDPNCLTDDGLEALQSRVKAVTTNV